MKRETLIHRKEIGISHLLDLVQEDVPFLSPQTSGLLLLKESLFLILCLNDSNLGFHIRKKEFIFFLL